MGEDSIEQDADAETGAPRGGSYADAAKDLVLAMAEGSPIDPTGLQTVQTTLDRMLVRNHPTMGNADRADAISDAFTSLLVAVRQGRVDPNRNPGAYIRKAADRRAIDQLRRSRGFSVELTGEESASEDDDTVARYLDAEASSQEVEEAVALLAIRGEHRANQVIGQWLVFAEDFGGTPSTREVAGAIGVSHDTVARYLKSFRDALVEVRSQHG